MAQPAEATQRRPRGGSERLRGLLNDAAGDGSGLWGPQELADLLRHQLESPLPGDDLSVRGGVVPSTFGQVLCGTDAPAVLLARVKGYAEAQGREETPGLPPEVARVLSLTVEAIRRSEGGEGGGDAELRTGIRWALGQPWLDASLRGVLERGLGSGDEGSGSSGDGAAGRAEPAGRERWPRVEGYEVLGPLGEGGMGTVWRAVQKGTGRVVALKVMREGGVGSPRARARFEREVELAARLEHPNVARVYDGRVDHRGTWFYAMELVEGRPLDGHVFETAKDAEGNATAKGAEGNATAKNAKSAKSNSAREYDERGGAPLPKRRWRSWRSWRLHFDEADTGGAPVPHVRQALALVEKVARAVQHAHQRGVIHRDLKPSNVLVTAAGEPKVLDFGLAKALVAAGEGRGRDLTVEGEVAGTAAFMSPEQAAGRAAEVDTRSDVYSLGGILYLLVTGRLPHAGDGSHLSVMRRVAEEEVTRPRLLEPGLESDLEAVLLKALAREPGRRYASAGELADDLGRFLRGEAVAAKPPTLAYLLRKRLRRHRAALSAAAAVAAALLGVVVVAYVRVHLERDRAVAAQGRAETAQRVEAAQRREAEKQRNEADAQRGAAEAARRESEERLADGLVAQGDAAAEAKRWPLAERLYEEAAHKLAEQHRSLLPADSGLFNAYRVAPPPLNVFGGHVGEVRAVAFCPDGQTAVSGGKDGTVRAWDVVTGRPLRTLRGHAAGVTCVAVSPGGSQVLSGSSDRTARLWDLRTSRELRRFDHAGEVTDVCFSPDGRLAGTAAWTAVAPPFHLWDLSTGRQAAAFGTNGGSLDSIAFDHDGRTCMTLGPEGYVFRWEVATGSKLGFVTADDHLRGMALFPEGRWVLAAYAGKGPETLRVLETATGNVVRTWETGLPDVLRVALSGDGERYLCAGGDGTIRVLDRKSGRELQTVWEQDNALGRVAFSPDGSLALAGSPDGTLRLYDLTGDARPPLLRRIDAVVSVHCVAATPDGRLLVSGSEERLQLWDAASGRLLSQSPPRPALHVLAVSPDGRHAITDEVDSGVRLWDLAHLENGGERLGTHDFALWAAAYSPDGRFALTHSGRQVKLWDMATRSAVRTYDFGKILARSIAFAPDGSRGMVASTHGSVLLWDLTSGAWLPTPGWWRGVGELSWDASFLDGGARALAASGEDLLLWDAFSGSLLYTLHGHTGVAHALDVAPDGAAAISAADDCTVRLWDLKAGREMRLLASGGGQPITTVRFTPDGRRALWGNPHFVVELDLRWPADYRAMQPRLAAAHAGLEADPSDPAALATLGEWYALMGKWDWARRLLEQARAKGAQVSAITLVRCLWACGDGAAAARELQVALEKGDPEAEYLRPYAGAPAGSAVEPGKLGAGAELIRRAEDRSSFAAWP